MYSAKSSNVIAIHTQREDNSIVLRPKFPSLSPNLTEKDKLAIEPAIQELKGRDNLFFNGDRA